MTVFIMRRGKFGHRDTDIHMEDGEMETTKARRGKRILPRGMGERMALPTLSFHIFEIWKEIFSRIILFVCLLPRSWNFIM